MCNRAAAKLTDRALALAIMRHTADLQAHALAASKQLGGLLHGCDYIVATEPA